MTIRVVFEPEASTELNEAVSWYDRRHLGLGLELLAEVRIAVDRLAQWPDLGAHVPDVGEDLHVRRVPVGRFPYHVVYLLGDGFISVIAIAHDRRRPLYWTHRP